MQVVIFALEMRREETKIKIFNRQNEINASNVVFCRKCLNLKKIKLIPAHDTV